MRVGFPRIESIAPLGGLVLLLILADTGYSQGRSVSIARRADEFSKQTDKVSRDQMEGEINGPRNAPSKEELRRAARIRSETKEDLETLQASYNTIVSALSGGASMPERDAHDVVRRIHKGASRMRANVALPKLSEEPTLRPTVDKRRALQELCLNIYNFLTNPVIEKPTVIEADSAMKASKILEAIITMSGRIIQAP